MNRNIAVIAVIALAALLLAGCDKSPSEISKDVTQARDQASKDTNEARQNASEADAKSESKVAEAQREYSKTDARAREKLTAAESTAMAAKAKSDFDVAVTEAQGRHSIAIKKCAAYTDANKTACESSADAALAVDKAEATARRDEVLVLAEHSN